MKNANPVSWLALLSVLTLGPILQSCSDKGSPKVAAATQPASTYFPIGLGAKNAQLQLALTDGEMGYGLMGRKDLGADQGMVFIYEKPTQMSFYMKNTPTALDIGFFSADGVLREIYPMYPFDQTTVSSRSKELKFAVEMTQGWYAANAVKPGAKLDLVALEKAIDARGFPGARLLRGRDGER